MHFERYDEDGDGFISLDENLKAPPLPPPAAERSRSFAGRSFANCSTCAQLSFGRSPRRALTAGAPRGAGRCGAFGPGLRRGRLQAGARPLSV
jgi:hypothetical protein